MTAPTRLFASCAPGLEPMLAEELRAVDALDVEAVDGGVRFAGHRKVIFRANLESGIATRVLARVGRFRARHFDQLVDGIAALEWERFCPAEVPRAFTVRCRKSRLHHTDAIAERAARAIARRLGDTCAEPSAGGSGVHLRLERDVVMASVDTSGEPLHRRGYRERTVAAPLREDLARALVIASGWDRASALVDPFAGAGTVPIEAAILARGLAPGRGRRFAFERAPYFHEPTWAEVRERAEAAARPGLDGPIVAADHSAEAIAASRLNADRAGVADDLRFEVAPISEVDLAALDGGGALVTHPPFGKRASAGRDLRPLYQAIGRRVAPLPRSVAVALLCTDRRLALEVDPGLKTAFLTDAGGLKVRALVRRSETS